MAGLMHSAWVRLQVKVALIWRALLINLSNFHLVQYRDVSGFLVSGKNSGTHWLRHMLSHAIAQRYGLPPPAFSSGRESEDFVGHPRWPRKHPHLPFIASSHNLPSSMLSWRWVRWLFDLPPVVVLVRDPKEAMLSHFVKWRDVLGLSLHDYICNQSTKRKQLADGWWYIDFFNRWGHMAEAMPPHVLVVRYEELQKAPEYWLGRISDHIGLGLDAAAIAAAMQVSSRESVQSTLDPAYGEAIVPDASERARARLSPAENLFLTRQFDEHLRYDFGYGHVRRTNRAARSAAGEHGLAWAKAGFLLAIGYAFFNQVGRPYFGLTLGAPWSQLELTGVFTIMTALGPQSFPKLKAAVPALLSAGGAMVEWAQHWRLAPGVGSLSDLTAEVAGIAVASTVMLFIASTPMVQGARQTRAFSSPRTSSGARAAEARPAPRPR
jgi:Sulfotransferase domain